MNNILATIIGLTIIFSAFYYALGDIDFLSKEATISIPEEEEVLIEKDPVTEEPDDESFVEEEMSNFVYCLKEEGVVIYGSEWCPFCVQLVESFGGYPFIDPIYVECTKEEERCQDEMHTSGVPEIQIKGELYTGSRELSVLGEVVGCEL